MKHLDFGNMSSQVEPSLCDIYARCVDIVQLVTSISFKSHYGLTVKEFRELEQIANDLLGLHMNISHRQSNVRVSLDLDDDGDKCALSL